MAPTPKENRKPRSYDGQQRKIIIRPLAGDEVVISGMSGIFPASDSVKAFAENLYNKVDMVATDSGRWVFNHPEVPLHLGKVNNMGKFDAQFFRVHYKQGQVMEPMSRKLLEHAYSAIYDSGINPENIRGKRTGVFIGSTFSESEQVVIYKNIQRNGFGITGCNKAMYANRISYWIDGKGPSYALDMACSSSMACLEHAYRAISSGQCDAAIVGGCNLCMHPCISLNLRRAGLLTLDGKTKCFDKNGDGYVRSDSISVLFIQKAKDANRIYAEVYHAKGNYGITFDAEFMPQRASEDFKSFLESFYSEIDVSPKDVEFVEANGSGKKAVNLEGMTTEDIVKPGIAEADGNELEAIGQVFAKDRTVLVGSVKSNMGHSEPASGCCSVTKALIAFEKGAIPPNLHYEHPQDQIEAVKEGRIRVVQDTTPFNRNFIALNSISYTGANIHILLKGHYKPKDIERYKCSIPRLIAISGRQEDCVENVLSILATQPMDVEQIGLLHNIHHYEIPGHMSRGYLLLSNDSDDKGMPVVLTKHSEYYAGITRPIWFCYSGMGSQWAGMGAELMKIPIFAAAIEKCRKVLEPKGIDILHILTHPDKKIYDNILHSFVGIAAVQIGITDILKAMEIVPDNIIGHSVGELGCAYADGCFTAEEMILAAYSRGLVSVQTPFIRGSMAAVGLGYKTILPLCPAEIEVACHNSSESSTISGPSEVMKKFVSDLTSKGIFAKEVPCSNIAYHSRYISGAGPGLLKYLSEVIKDPKPRSEKWVSTSVPQDNWKDPIALYSSAEYHTNNLLNPVLFEETSKMIPSNAVVIEVAPHGLLQAILKRSHAECVHVPLTRRGHADPVKFFLEAIGTLYEIGLYPDLSVLYPKIQFPVSTGTPLISHLVEWEHSENWPQAFYNSMDRVTAAVRNVVVSIHDDDIKYLAGYMRNGLIVFPEAAILVLLWETFAMQKGKTMDNFSVSFSNVNFVEEAVIQTEKPLRLSMMIHKGNNHFEVNYEGVPIVSGFIQEITEDDKKLPQVEPPPNDEEEVTLTGKDIYNLMYQKGYQFGKYFQVICSAGSNRTTAQIKWSTDWTRFIDSLIQFTVFSRDYEGISLPKVIKKLVINVEAHNEMSHVTDEANVKCYGAVVNNVMQTSQCGGVQIHGMVLKDQPLIDDSPDLLVSRDFVPHFPIPEVSVETALNLVLQIAQDNVSKDNLKVTVFTKPAYRMPNIIRYVSDNLPFAIEVKSVLSENVDFDVLVSRDPSIKESHVLVVDDFLGNERKMQDLQRVTPNNTFVLTWERNTTKLEIKYKYFTIISVVRTHTHIAVLLNKMLEKCEDNVIYIPVAHDEQFSWVPRVQAELLKARKVTLVSERQPLCGLYGLVKSLRKEHGDKIGLVVIADFCGPTFNPEKDIFKEYLQKNLLFNILKNGQWGGYYNAPCAMTSRTPNITLTSTVPGNLDSLTWVEAESTQSTNNVVQVCYAGPSYRDAQNAAGKKLTDNKLYGLDFSGIDSKGEKVMGLIEGGSVASTVTADLDLIWPVPDYWTLEDAATVPLPYVHAYYILVDRIDLLSRSKVFVHGGTGALGQAVLSICLGINCTVYTTVSDVHKKQFLMKMFPDLDENNIGNSRNDSFVEMVSTNTKNKGCDIVINCAGGDIRNAAMKCTGFSGYFLDCDDGDMIENSDFGMHFLSFERNYKAVNLKNIFKPENREERMRLQVLVSEGIKKGLVRPLSRVVYSPVDVSRAFRLLSLSRHRGRAIIRIRDHVSSSSGLEAVPRMTYSPEHSYLVVSDGNIFGVELADLLVRRGARNLMIHVKSNNIDGYFCTKMASWRKLGVNVKISNESLQTEEGCVSVLTDLARLGPVGGIFVAQPSNPDTRRPVTQADFVSKFSETALIVANLDLVSRNFCGELSYFVVVTQSSDNRTVAFTNSVSERICLERAETRLPALYHQIGRLAEFDTATDESNHTKLAPQSMKAAFRALEASLKLKYCDVSSYKFTHHQTKFVDKVMRVLGLTDVISIPDNTSLSDLRLSDVIIEEIKTAIREETGMIYPNAKVARMTIADLKRLAGSVGVVATKFDSGLGAFFTYIDADECMASEPMVVMPTKCSNATENEDELDSKAPYLMLIPGFEGHHQIYTSITERLKIEALTFQLTPLRGSDTIRDMAVNMRTFMKKRFELKSKFYLMGYSFGVNVALELAALMEQEGHVGVVYCLDSSPDALRVQLDAYLGNLTDETLQNAIVEHMYRLMSGKAHSSDKFKSDLLKCDTWSQKVEICVQNIKGMVTYSHQYIRYLLETAYKRISLARNYVPDLKLESKIVLFRGIQHPKGDSLPNDYYLSKYTKQPVGVFHLKADHAMAPQDCRVSNIVNNHLDSTVLEDFLAKNVCETYLADPIKII